MSGFLQALPFVLRMEGGYVDDPDDRGGETNYGVTHKTYDAWRESQGLEKRSVKEIEPEEVQAIYHDCCWLEGKCDALPWPVSAAHFDACVNHGPENAARLLQEAAGAIPDGIIGPKTLASVSAMHPKALLREWYWVRLDFYYRISKGGQMKFLRGWLRRVIHLREALGP